MPPLLEAGACGKPVLAGSSGGQPEAVLDGETGIVIDGADQQRVDEALGRLCRDTMLGRRLGEAGRERALALDWSNVAERTWNRVRGLSETAGLSQGVR